MKKFLVVLLVIVCIGLGAGVVFLKGSDDNEGPKITFEEGKDTSPRLPESLQCHSSNIQLLQLQVTKEFQVPHQSHHSSEDLDWMVHPEDVEKYLGLSVLGTIPYVSKLGKKSRKKKKRHA